MSLSLSPEHAATLSRWARGAYPHETCGLLIGQRGGNRARVVEVTRARNRNVERPRDRYDLDPTDQLAAEELARELGLEVVGVWHSHPDHPARPSETDRAAAWSGWSYVIVAVGPDEALDVRSWRMEEDRFVEESIDRCHTPP